MRRMPRSATTFAFLLLARLLMHPASAQASAWTLPRGPHLWVELYWQQYHTGRDFDQQGRRVGKVNDGRFREFRNEIKLELPSWDDRLNFLVSAPFDFARYEDRNVTLTNRGGEEATVGAKWRVTATDGPLILALQPAVSFPLSGYDVSDQPPLADCQADWEGRLVVGRPLRTDANGWVAGYVSGEVGYRAREKAPTDEIPFFVEGAWRIASSPVWAKAFVDGVQSRAPRAGEQEEDYLKWTASVMLSRDPVSRGSKTLRRVGVWFLEAGVVTVVWGKNTGVSRVVFVKVAYQS